MKHKWPAHKRYTRLLWETITCKARFIKTFGPAQKGETQTETKINAKIDGPKNENFQSMKYQEKQKGREPSIKSDRQTDRQTVSLDNSVPHGNSFPWMIQHICPMFNRCSTEVGPQYHLSYRFVGKHRIVSLERQQVLWEYFTFE